MVLGFRLQGVVLQGVAGKAFVLLVEDFGFREQPTVGLKFKD